VRLRCLAAVFLLSSLQVGGCRTPEPVPAQVTLAEPLFLGEPLAEPDAPAHATLDPVSTNSWLSAGQSVRGREVEYSVHGQGDLTVMLLAGIHGDEECGTPRLLRLHAELTRVAEAELLMGRTLVIVPRVNPDGLLAEQRHNANGVDLNRNFQSDNFRTSAATVGSH
jgi:predicted deacylase